MNDAMALGAFKAVREAGKKVPDDYSIVGFDDLVFADSIDPSLTTVGLDQYLWGKEACPVLFLFIGTSSQVKESCGKSEEEVLVKSRLIRARVLIRSYYDIYLHTTAGVQKNLKSGKRFPYIFIRMENASSKNHLSGTDDMIKESMFISAKGYIQ